MTSAETLPTLPPLRFDRQSFLAEDRPVFVISGELHYFRLQKSDYRDRLAKLKAAGGNCVGTYIPWLLHEPREGEFDFSTYDLESFLVACREVGLWVLARPGPYQYSELAYEGLPGWLIEGHPEVRARRANGSEIRPSSVSYLHPTFLRKARAWYQAVMPRLIPHLVTRGGAIALLQIDNELIGVHEWYGSLDHHPDSYGIGRELGRWPDFLRRRHESVDRANMAYGTTARSFAELTPMSHGSDDGARRLARDWQACYVQSIAEYSGVLAAWMREAGVDVPIVHNYGNPEMAPYFREMVFPETAAPVGGGVPGAFLLGGDHYYNLDQTWSQDRPSPHYVARCAYSCDLMRSWGFPPSVLEMPAGSPADWPPITAHDAECAYLANLAYGMKAVNYYVFAGGPNPPGAGISGEVYDYHAAVAPDGTLRPLYFAQRAISDLIRREPWLAHAERVVDCRIGLVADHLRAARWFGDRGSHLASHSEIRDFALRGPWSTASCAGLSPEFVDLERGDPDIDKPLIVPSSAAMPAELQQRLVDYIERGGNVLLSPVVPYLDNDLRDCSILIRALGGVKQQRIEPAASRLVAWSEPNVFVNGPLFAAMDLPPGAVVHAREERSGQAVSWTCRLGRGRVTVLGLQWLHSRREHASMLVAALSDLGLSRVLDVDNPLIWAVLRADAGHWLLFLLNLFTSTERVRVRFRDPVHGTPVDTGIIEVAGTSVAIWPRP